MNTAPNAIPLNLKGRLNQARGNVTQAAKRALLRLRVVPPPFRIQIDITDRCNFRCPTCSKWLAADAAHELTRDEWGTVFRKIRRIPLLREISITGGEPLVRPDIMDILSLAREQQLRIVLISNGWHVTEEILQKVEQIGVDVLLVSLNSLDPSIHDGSRTAPGSHARIMQLIETWRKRQRTMGLCLQAVVIADNCEELCALARFAQEKGLNGILYQALAPVEVHYSFSTVKRMLDTKKAWYDHHPDWVRDVDTLRSEITSLLCMQRAGYPVLNPSVQLKHFPLYYEDPDATTAIPCLGTLSRMYIDPFGDIRLCYGYPPVGNALHDDPMEGWRGGRARGIRRDSRTCSRLCRVLNNNL